MVVRNLVIFVLARMVIEPPQPQRRKIEKTQDRTEPQKKACSQHGTYITCSIQGLYDTLNPTNKKVLETLIAQPNTDVERDALKFLQRYIGGLDNGKLIQFLRFTTASDVLIANKLEVTFTKFEGAACRPIAHTCGPLLEVPSIYSNFVELREQFNNILEKDIWEMDIM